MNKKTNAPWVEKYRPQTTKDIVGFDSIIKKITIFLKNFAKKLHEKTIKIEDKAIILEGPPGIGKTTVVYAIANDLGYNVVEMNASDARTEGAIKKKLGESISSTNLLAYMNDTSHKNKKIIFIDEVDGISGQSDRGGVATLMKMIVKSKNPIIMTSNFYETKLRSIYDKVQKIKCSKIRTPSIIKILKKITSSEKLKIDENSLKVIAENAIGDVRSAINDLQGLAQGSTENEIDIWDVYNVDLHRDTTEKIFSFIESMFKRNTLREIRNVASNADLDYNFLHRIVHANLPNFVDDVEDKCMALINLAESNLIMGRIKRKMDFSLLPYFFDLVSGGIVISVKNPNLSGYKKYISPRFFNPTFSAAEDPVTIEMQKKFLVSKYSVISKIIPPIKEILNNLPKNVADELTQNLAKEFGVDYKILKKKFRR